MNKSDIKLLVILFIIVIIICLSTLFFQSDEDKNALVYYENNLVLTIDLTKAGTQTYTIDGALGNVIIEKKDNMVRVIEENSPNHICSKQGYIKESYEVLICLPNKVVVKIDKQAEIDTIVK